MFSFIKSVLNFIIPHYSSEQVAVLLFEDDSLEVLFEAKYLHEGDVYSLIGESRGISWLFWTFGAKVYFDDEEYNKAPRYDRVLWGLYRDSE